MTETPGSYAGKSVLQPSRRLTRAEQIELLLWHPLFTGKCPHCGQVLVNPQFLVQWQCSCGWKEHNSDK